MYLDRVSEDLSHLLDRFPSGLWNVEVDEYFADDAKSHEEEVHPPSSGKVSAPRTNFFEQDDSHIPERQWSWCTPRDRTGEIGKHAQCDALGTKICRPDLGAPYK